MEPPILQDEFFDKTERESDVLKYIAGAMCRKFNLKAKETQTPDSWISIKGQGRLIEPSDDVFEAVKQFDDIFNSFHGKEL